MVRFDADLGQLTDQVHLVEVDMLVVRATGEADLVSELISGLLVLALDLDGVDNFLETAPIVEQANREEEEAESINASHHSIEGREP